MSERRSPYMFALQHASQHSWSEENLSKTRIGVVSPLGSHHKIFSMSALLNIFSSASSFEHRVLKFIKGNQRHKHAILCEEILPRLSSETEFNNPNIHTLLIFLRLWEHLLANVDTTRWEERGDFFTAIVLIMRWHDFDVTLSSNDTSWERMNFPTSSDYDKRSSRRVHDDPLWQSVVNQYLEMLWRTYLYVIDKLAQNGSFKALLNFCAKVMVTSYFRIPNLARIIMKHITTTQAPLSPLHMKINMLLRESNTLSHNGFQGSVPHEIVHQLLYIRTKSWTDLQLPSCALSYPVLPEPSKFPPSMKGTSYDDTTLFTNARSCNKLLSSPSSGGSNNKQSAFRENRTEFRKRAHTSESAPKIPGASSGTWLWRFSLEVGSEDKVKGSEHLAFMCAFVKDFVEQIRRKFSLFSSSDFMETKCNNLSKDESPGSRVPWFLVPGYDDIVYSFICRIIRHTVVAKTISVTESPLEKMVEAYPLAEPRSEFTFPGSAEEISALVSVCNNVDILDAIVAAVLSRTSAHSVRTVSATLNFFTVLFDNIAVTEGVRCLPFNFTGGTGALEQAIKILLDSDHHQVLMHTLVFIHSILRRLPTRIRERVIDSILMEDVFFRLFMHWHASVRFLFHHIVVARLVLLRSRNEMTSLLRSFRSLGSQSTHDGPQSVVDRLTILISLVFEINNGNCHSDQNSEDNKCKCSTWMPYAILARAEFQELLCDFDDWIRTLPSSLPYLIGSTVVDTPSVDYNTADLKAVALHYGGLGTTCSNTPMNIRPNQIE